MNLNHFAVGLNSREDSDKFFIELLGMQEARNFPLKKDLNKAFFNVDKEITIIRYEKNDVAVEAIIDDQVSRTKDLYTHVCIIVDDKEAFYKKATSLGFECIKHPRDDGNGFFLFVKDSTGNIYEIK